jgi:hypothetical protein
MLNKQGRKWLSSKVTLHDAGSYTVAGKRFLRGRPTTVTSEKVRKALNGISGFHITDLWEAKEKPLPPQEVEEPDTVKDDESDSEPKGEKPKVVVPHVVKTIKVRPKAKSESKVKERDNE